MTPVSAKGGAPLFPGIQGSRPAKAQCLRSPWHGRERPCYRNGMTEQCASSRLPKSLIGAQSVGDRGCEVCAYRARSDSERGCPRPRFESPRKADVRPNVERPAAVSTVPAVFAGEGARAPGLAPHFHLKRAILAYPRHQPITIWVTDGHRAGTHKLCYTECVLRGRLHLRGELI